MDKDQNHKTGFAKLTVMDEKTTNYIQLPTIWSEIGFQAIQSQNWKLTEIALQPKVKTNTNPFLFVLQPPILLAVAT